MSKATATSSSKKNHPDPPKKPQTSFFRWVSDNRDQFKKKNPEVKGKDFTKLLGKEWNSLTDKEKKKYEDMYTKEKAKFDVEIKAYEDKWGPLTKKSRMSKAKEDEVKGKDKEKKAGKKMASKAKN